MLAQFARGREVVIVGDSDEPGRKGAEALARELALHCPAVRVVYPPDGIKDLREWKSRGLTKAALREAIQAAQLVRHQIVSKTATHRRRERHG